MPFDLKFFIFIFDQSIMACCRCFECILELLNFILTLAGLSMIGYGIYLLVEFIKLSNDSADSLAPSSNEMLTLGRPIFATVALSDNILDYLPKAWFIYLFIGVGVIVVIISLFGCCGIVCRNTCCLSCYSFLIILLILLELGAAGFIFFDESWKDVIPTDKTGNFDTIYDFLEDNWKIAKRVALGVVVFEVLLFLLALGVRASNKPIDYDSDEEFINPGLRQPLVRQTWIGEKMMKAPGRGGARMFRLSFENNPKGYFRNLRAGRPLV